MEGRTARSDWMFAGWKGYGGGFHCLDKCGRLRSKGARLKRRCGQGALKAAFTRAVMPDVAQLPNFTN